MLVARKIDAEYYQPQSHRDKGKRPGVRVRSLHRLFRVLVVFSVAMFFVLGLLLTSQAAIITNKGYEVVRLKQEISSLQTANERLKLEIAQMDSLERIETIALADLGMEKPSADDYLLLPLAEQEEILLAQGRWEKDITPAEGLEQESPSILHRLASAIIHPIMADRSQL